MALIGDLINTYIFIIHMWYLGSVDYIIGNYIKVTTL